MRLCHRAAIGGLLLQLGLALLPAAAPAQQGVNNYFARTPESDRLLQSNELNHLGKGIDNLRSGRFQYAKNEFDFILNLWPNHPQALGLMADTLVKLRQPELIDQYYERAYELSPDVAVLYVTHGVTLLRLNRNKEAIERLQRGAALDDNSMNAHYNLGLALVRVKRFEEANRHAQRAYALGHPLPGLREQLQRAKAWKPEVAAAVEKKGQ
jgi:tetratricopeptide (TPR) repeat protein